MSISELRQKALITLCEMSNNQDAEVLDRAKHFMNCLYRVNGIENRLLVMENDSGIYFRHKKYIAALNTQSEKGLKKLNTLVKEYGEDLQVISSGGYVNIVKCVNNSGGISNLHLCHYYN